MACIIMIQKRHKVPSIHGWFHQERGRQIHCGYSWGTWITLSLYWKNRCSTLFGVCGGQSWIQKVKHMHEIMIQKRHKVPTIHGWFHQERGRQIHYRGTWITLNLYWRKRCSALFGVCGGQSWIHKVKHMHEIMIQKRHKVPTIHGWFHRESVWKIHCRYPWRGWNFYKTLSLRVRYPKRKKEKKKGRMKQVEQNLDYRCVLVHTCTATCTNNCIFTCILVLLLL